MSLTLCLTQDKQYIQCNLNDVVTIKATSMDAEKGDTQDITTIYIKTPTYKDQIKLDRINLAIHNLREAYNKVGQELVLSGAYKPQENKKSEEKSTPEQQVKDFLESVAQIKPTEYQKVIDEVWLYIKDRIYTEDGIVDLNNYNPIFDFKNNDWIDQNMELYIELSYTLPSQYMFFFMRRFTSLVAMTK